MKKILAPFTLFFLAGILLSSCSNSSKLSITKRHYRSGYCIDFSRRIPTIAAAKIIPVNRHKSVPVVTAKPENCSMLNTSTEVKPAIFHAILTPVKLQVHDVKTMPLSTTSTNISITNTNSINESRLLQNDRTLSEGNGGGDRASERDALSLLWIIIVIILILWLIGIIAGGFGLGGLINLLLIIALILFILWLLRIW